MDGAVDQIKLVRDFNRYYTRRVERPAEEVQQRVGEVSAITHESFDGVLVVKTLGREGDECYRMLELAPMVRQTIRKF